VGVAVLAGACATPASGGGGGTAPTYRDGRCVGTEGVTIVVDFDPFGDDVLVRCALGPQANGFAVLDNAGFQHDPGPNPGTVCQIEGLPTQGYPYCWTTGGYWSYWRAAVAGDPWSYRVAGAASTAPGPGAVEGWRFAPFSAGTAQPPRVGTSGPIVP
jgi:hypothetical protein